MSERKHEEVLYSSFQNTEEGKKELYEYSKKKILEGQPQTNYNSLTKLPALRLFFYEAGEIIRAKPEQKYAVLVMDITQFKAVNEFLGRSEGDRLLRFIGECLAEYVRSRPDTAASHVRADNFCLFTSYREKGELAELAIDLKRRVEELPFAYRVILSIGICASEETEPAVNYLKDCAAIAMAEIKGKYYADYKFFSEDMRTKMLQEKQIESDVVGALKNGDIVPYIQPKVYMDTGEIVGGEALARWKYQGGLMRPDRFIPVIERNGMIIEVDRCIWEQVFRYQRKVMDEGRTPVPISINVSRMHIYDKNHMNDVLYGLRDKYRVPVEYIPLELTESAFAPGEDEIQGRMQKLREQGFIISMDDFGSGYSSLNMLKARELDEIKVDKEFMGDLDREKSRIVLKHLLAMLHELNVDIIVEGVETEAQRDFLLENNCRRAQGFLYYRPMPLDDFDALMKSGA